MNTVLINQMSILFIIIAVGYLLFKIKYLTEEVIAKLTRLLLDVTLPLMIIASVMNTDSGLSLAKIGSVFLISFCMYVGLTILSVVLIKLLHFPAKDQGMYMFMHTFANTAFMGFPIIEALFGSAAMLYTAILNIMFNLFAYTVGIIMANYDAGAGSGKEVLKLMNPKHLLSTGTLGSLLAIVIYFLPVHFPTIVTGVCDRIGGLSSTLAMLIIGGTLAKIPVKNIFNDWHVYLFTFVKQLVVPFAVWPLMKLLVGDEFIRKVLFVLFIMPVANTAVLFATRYEKDKELAAKTVFLTTLASMVTIPLLVSVLKI